MTYEEKKQRLWQLLEEYTQNDCLIAFSGGVDSSVLLQVACDLALENKTRVHAVTIQSELHPVGDLEISKRVAKEIGAIHHVMEIRELQEAGILHNPKERCYLCKKYLFSQAKKLAEELQISVIMEGTNEDDLHVYRPGLGAVKELGIKSPLAEAGFTKAEVRRLAGELSLSVASRPATPCLATRFPYGAALSMGAMKQVEQAEGYLRAQGYKNVRARVHDTILRLEIDREDFSAFLAQREELIKELKRIGYHYITLDLEGFRSGSMDEIL